MDIGEVDSGENLIVVPAPFGLVKPNSNNPSGMEHNCHNHHSGLLLHDVGPDGNYNDAVVGYIPRDAATVLCPIVLGGVPGVSIAGAITTEDCPDENTPWGSWSQEVRVTIRIDTSAGPSVEYAKLLKEHLGGCPNVRKASLKRSV